MFSVGGSSLREFASSVAKGAQLTTAREESTVVASRPLEQKELAASGNPNEATQTRYTSSPRLSPAQQRQVDELRQIDRAVRQHETAHLRAGQGVVTSGARFNLVRGPDDNTYAVAGEVGIDTAPEQEPRANIDKGRSIQAAALAPNDPSPQDFRVAAVGGQLEAQGHRDLADQLALERVQEAARSRNQRETNQTQQAARQDAAARQARSVGEAPNAEPASPTAGENDLTRQRLANAYRPLAAAAASLSVFA